MKEALGNQQEQPKNPTEEFLTPGKIETFRQAMIEACKTTWENRADEIIATDLEEALGKETTFAREVITAYQRWAEEKDAVVLWDVDETMGNRSLSGKGGWGFRVSFLPLMQFLKEKYPHITNGILSNRTVVKDQLTNPAELQPIQKYIDEQHIYSSRSFISKLYADDETYDKGKALEKEAEELVEATDTSLTLDLREKYGVLKTLKEKGINPKIIDDGAIAKAMKEDGVYIYDVKADSSFVAPIPKAS